MVRHSKDWLEFPPNKNDANQKKKKNTSNKLVKEQNMKWLIYKKKISGEERQNFPKT